MSGISGCECRTVPYQKPKTWAAVEWKCWESNPSPSGVMSDGIGITARSFALIHLSVPCHAHEDYVLVCRINEIIFCTSILTTFSATQIRSHGIQSKWPRPKTENSGINAAKTAHPSDQCPISSFLHLRLRLFAGNWGDGFAYLTSETAVSCGLLHIPIDLGHWFRSIWDTL